MIRDICAYVGAWFLLSVVCGGVWCLGKALHAWRYRCQLCLVCRGHYHSRMGRVCGPCLDAIFAMYDRPKRRPWQPKPSRFDGEGWRNG
ncbi:MAG TPA: hypothetical protein VJO33_17095 [Gemmatimonadaceae bacterium]|nr:hypothetical protein [Gemmatimonadaceae bacterium]